MKAYNYVNPGVAELIDKEKPEIKESTDAIIRMVKTTICGTDLHIIKGDTPEVTANTTLGHEGIGIVESVGSNVNNFKVGTKLSSLQFHLVVNVITVKRDLRTL